MRLGKRRLAPAEMYPAGEDGVSARMLELPSGIQVRVVEAGDAASPAIVLVPGWGCSVWIFHASIAALGAAGFRVIAVDPKGHGLSDKPRAPSEYTSMAMRDNLLEILDAIGVKRAALLGHSMGAATVARVAEAAPGRVSKLVLVAPVGFAGVPGMSLFRVITPSFVVPLLRRIAARPFFRLILAMVYGSRQGVTDREVEEFFAPTQFADFTLALRHLLHEFTWDAPFPRVSMPLLTIAGSKDILSRARDIGRYSSVESETRRVVVKNAGHVIFDEAPEIVNAAIADFLRA
ncbi:MAG: alpha/beta hydrolase [Gemmatimonadales bacterium]